MSKKKPTQAYAVACRSLILLAHPDISATLEETLPPRDNPDD